MGRQNDSAEASAAPVLSAEQFQQLLQAVVTQRASLDVDTLQTILRENSQSTAQAMQKAMKPENPFHPGKSVFSHPDGDEKVPKPPLPYELYWQGYPVHKFPETETWQEWLLQSNMPGPGEYPVIRNDGSVMKVKVEAETNANGKMTKVIVTHPAPREGKDHIPSKPVILAQMCDPKNAKQQFIKAMTDQFEAMLSNLQES